MNELRLKFYNTLTDEKEFFKPLKKKVVKLYACGPTVYAYAHIGNLRTYLFEDFLKRTLIKFGYQVKHVMNITDVGHLTSDADTGEDKIEKASQKEKKSAWEIAEFYTQAFKNDLKKLNIFEPTVWCKATDYIQEQIDLIKILEKKGFTYQTSDGIYFDTSKLKTYGRLLNIKGKKELKSRLKIQTDKKNPEDFALWKFSPEDKKRQMEWQSPWGIGFPGWHSECLAMSQKNLGTTFDIHCGGVDHIAIHHNNEIAQSEAAFGKIPARFWLHGEFLNLNKEKMAKSKGALFTLDNLIKKGFDPLSYRYLVLGTHYRQKMNFDFESLKSGENALNNLRQFLQRLNQEEEKLTRKTIKKSISRFRQDFLKNIADDLNMPKALAVMWKLMDFYNRRSSLINPDDIKKIILEFDEVLGLELESIFKEKIPQKIKSLVAERERARRQKNWERADQIRDEIDKLGYLIDDSPAGPKIFKK